MQKHFLILLCACLFAMPFCSIGQQWLTIGNSGTTPGTHFLGTTDDKSLIFKTNNLERFSILNTGDVGIGISNPLAKLHIGGKTMIETDWDAPLTLKATDDSWQYIQFLGNVRKAWVGIDQSNNFQIFKEPEGNILLMGAPVGIGTASPRSSMEMIGNARLSASPGGSSFILESSGMTTSNDYSNVKLIASSSLGKGYLQTRLDNFGGTFTWVRGSASGDVTVMAIDATSGNAGIGTSSPQTRLDLGELRLGPITTFPAEGSIGEGIWGNYIIGGLESGQKLRLGVSNDGYTRAEIFLDNSNRQDGTIAFKTVHGGGGVLTRMFVNGDGNVGIGTTNINDESYKLFVETGIRTRKVKVDQAVWPDFVFHPAYRLRPLTEVAQYIQQHRHLPDVPSAEEVEKEGLDLGDNQSTLLKKIEELTLYLIEQNKKLEEQQQEITKLKKLVLKQQ